MITEPPKPAPPHSRPPDRPDDAHRPVRMSGIALRIHNGLSPLQACQSFYAPELLPPALRRDIEAGVYDQQPKDTDHSFIPPIQPEDPHAA